jgi:hypothetical protein
VQDFAFLGRKASLLVAFAPAGSYLFRLSRRSLRLALQSIARSCFIHWICFSNNYKRTISPDCYTYSDYSFRMIAHFGCIGAKWVIHVRLDSNLIVTNATRVGEYDGKAISTLHRYSENLHFWKLIGAEGARLLREMRESWDPAGQSPRRLNSRPAESEHLQRKSTTTHYSQKQQYLRK